MSTSRFDPRFSSPGAHATPWPAVEAVLVGAELYWLTTVRADGRPHVTPLIGVWIDGAAYFSTGLEEQKARNLEHSAQVALATGVNTWDSGHDVVVEGAATRLTDEESLQRFADVTREKYGDAWSYDIEGDVLTHGGGHPAGLFRIDPAKVLSFAKDPHAQTAYYPS